MWGFGYWLIALLVVKISHWIYRWGNPKCSGKLPPGSMGFPIIGETIEFFKPYGFNEIPPFVKKRMLRYGSLFRTSILGSKAIVSTDPEVNFEIFRQENKSFILSYPDSFFKIFGKDNFFFKHGRFHKYIRQITMKLFGSESLKRRIILDMDQATREHLKMKASEGVFDAKDVTANLIIGYITSKMISDIKPESKRELIDNCRAFNGGWFRSSLNLSARKTLYNCVVARRNAIKMIKEMATRRKASAENYGDFLDTMLGELEKEGTILNEDRAIELIFSLLLLSHESTSIAVGLAVKFIAENPKALAELKREHEAILQNRADKESGVTWEEYRTMTFTHMVINESLRLGTLAPIMFRKAVNDVEIKGYTIPAGWIVVVAPSVVHYDPEKYENPNEFDPWRWEGKELHSGSKTFMAFGGGVRLCAGAEFAKLQMAIFLHYLVTKYNFSSIKEGEITRTPLLRFSKGLRIRISESCE